MFLIHGAIENDTCCAAHGNTDTNGEKHKPALGGREVIGRPLENKWKGSEEQEDYCEGECGVEGEEENCGLQRG
jgi:hypothetical protein